MLASEVIHAMPSRPGRAGREALSRTVRSLRQATETYFRSPNLLVGTALLLLAAVLMVIFKPGVGPAPRIRTIVIPQGLPEDMSAKPVTRPLPSQPKSEPSTAAGAPPTTASNPTPTAGVMPVKGPLVAGYGFVFEKNIDEWDFHPGWDIGVPIGAKVVSAFAGKVISVTNDPALGREVTIQSGHLLATYAGLGLAVVTPGEAVLKGATIGQIGEPGPLESFEGPHLHFALTESGKAVDPGTIIRP